MDDRAFASLLTFLNKVPAVTHVSHGAGKDNLWWVKFNIEIDHDLAWNVVQELASVLNYLSVNERLPTTFKPVSPPVYLNGGPADYLSWIIEAVDSDFRPGHCAKWLAARLPNPVDDLSSWNTDE